MVDDSLKSDTTAQYKNYTEEVKLEQVAVSTT